MPVLSVGGLNQLIAEGKLDGRVSAVGGWWIPTMSMSCPAPARWIAPLESYCGNNIFASRSYAAFSCTSDGTSCGSNGPPPGVDILEPLNLIETSTGPAFNVPGNGPGLRMVLVGHVGDPRQWDCFEDDRAACARAFVIDSVAWIDGQEVALVGGSAHLQTRLTVDEAIAVANGGTAVAAVAVTASEVETVDPRLHETGQAAMWVVRTFVDTGNNADDPTRAASVWVIDDATGQVLRHEPLAMDPATQPSLLRLQATTAGECCVGDLYPSYSVDTADGQGIAERPSGGWASGTDLGLTRWGAGTPVLLEPGDYVVHAWLSGRGGNGDIGAHRAECQTTVSIEVEQSARVEAAFPASGACSFVTPTFGDKIF